MDRNTIAALDSCGIKIKDVQYKYPEMDIFGLDDDAETKFVIKGSFHEEVDIKHFIKEIIIMRTILRNEHPAVKDLYDQLQTIAGIAK